MCQAPLYTDRIDLGIRDCDHIAGSDLHVGAAAVPVGQVGGYVHVDFAALAGDFRRMCLFLVKLLVIVVALNDIIYIAG